MYAADLWPQLREHRHLVTFDENVPADKPFSTKLLDEQIVIGWLGISNKDRAPVPPLTGGP